MIFPLPEPESSTCETLHKVWARVDLARYLQRWERSKIASWPDGLSAFVWRGLDIGCGFGKYILRQSERFPERGYLGIDKGVLRGGNMLKRAQESGHANLFGIHGNVTPVVATFADALFDEITIFYPNPWWPAKHRKKRWSYHPILPKIVSLLKPGGVLTLTSNEAFYLAEWCYALNHHPALKDQLQLAYAGPIEISDPAEGRTHFETKFIEEGVACGEIRFQRSD